MSFGPLKRLAVGRAGGQHGARTVLLEAHHRAVVVGAPDEPALRVQARAARADQQHVRAAAARLCAGVAHVRAGIAGLLHEHRHFVVRRDFVDDVVEQAADEQVAGVAFAHPDGAFVQAEAARDELGFGIARDDRVERRVRARDAERLRGGRRAVAAHVRHRCGVAVVPAPSPTTAVAMAIIATASVFDAPSIRARMTPPS